MTTKRYRGFRSALNNNEDIVLRHTDYEHLQILICIINLVNLILIIISCEKVTLDFFLGHCRSLSVIGRHVRARGMPRAPRADAILIRKKL